MDLPRAPEPDESAERPPTGLRVAGLLWVANGVVLLLSGVGLFARPLGVGLVAEVVLPVLLVAGGTYLWRKGRLLGRGGDARRGLLVVGLTSCLLLWPALLVVPAVVLQSRSDATRWFDQAR